MFTPWDPATQTLILTGLLVVLLLSGRVRAEVVGLLTLVAVVGLGLLSPGDALSGFASPAVVALIFIFILAHGLEASGVADALAARLESYTGASESRALVVVMAATALLSLFMNTAAAAAVVLPSALELARRQNFSPARLLLPLAYAALLGGMATLLTTANLVVSATLESHGYRPFGVLDFLPIGIPATLVGMAYMVVWGRRLLPQGPAPAERIPHQKALAEMLRAYDLQRGVHVLRVGERSPLVGRPPSRPHLARELGLTPVGVKRLGEWRFMPDLTARDLPLQPGDVLVVIGEEDPERWAEYDLHPTTDPDVWPALQHQDGLAEVALHPRGQAAGQTPQSLRLREKYGALVLAVWRDGRAIHHGLHRLPLRLGDVLLLLGPPARLALLEHDPDLLLLRRPRARRPRAAWHPWAAAGAMLLALGLTAAQVFPLPIAAIVGAAVVLGLGIVQPDEAYRAVPWRAIFLIAGVFPLSLALTRTGAAARLVQAVFAPIQHAPPRVFGALMLLLSAALAQIMSGQVAALVLAPLAISLAEARGLSVHGLSMAVAVGASMAFVLPTGHAVNLLVMGPGGYRPRDYFRVGLPLLLLLVPVVTLLLPGL
ncbi:MAG: hypothetical protein GXO37_03240 [Chloroflexi bacterium]|nr:hypothetical protein [Chloroflexota bacterium]